MKQSKVCYLAAMIMAAPHTSPGAALSVSVVMIVLGVLWQWREE